jgi:hypothetical protein
VCMKSPFHIMNSKQSKSNKNKNKQPKKITKNRGEFGDAQLVIYVHPKGIPFPPRYRTSLRIGIVGSVAATTAPTVYSCTANNLYLPFNGGGWPSVQVASIATAMPAGFRNLCNSNGPYYNYRVYGSRIKAAMTAVSSADVIVYTLLPTNAALGPSSVADAKAEPRCKETRTQGSSVMTILKHQISVAEFFGVTKQTVQCDTVGLYSAAYNAAPTQIIGWFLNWTTQAGGTTNGIISYEIDMVIDVEFFNLQYGALADV